MGTEHKVYLGGLPGTGKSTCGLSFPSVEQHVWGIGEEATAENFHSRKDVLPPVIMKWRECLTDEELDDLANPETKEQRMDLLIEKGKYNNILRYKKYIFKLHRDLETGKRPELETVFLDNLTPFSDEFKHYVMKKHASDIWTSDGNFDGRKFWPKYADELADFIREVVALPCNVVISSHLNLSYSEEDSRKAFDAGANKLNKEWLPALDGKIRFQLAGLFTFGFFLWAEESPGKDNKYYAKLEADERNIGLAKTRIQPFKNPRRILLPKNNFYNFLNETISNFKQGEK